MAKKIAVIARNLERSLGLKTLFFDRLIKAQADYAWSGFLAGLVSSLRLPKEECWHLPAKSRICFTMEDGSVSLSGWSVEQAPCDRSQPSADLVAVGVDF